MVNHDYVSDAQIKDILTFANGITRSRIVRMMLFMSLNGLRSINFRNLVISDVYNQDGSVKNIIDLKNDKNKGKFSAQYYVNKQLKKELEAYYLYLQTEWGDKFSSDICLFTPNRINKPYARGSICRIFHNLYKKFGIHGASHMGRHIFITKLINQSVNPFIVQKLVNHRSIQTTQRYYNADPRRLLNAVEMAKF